MNTDERREQILYTLKQTNTPITGSELANIFKVSRQIIVGDITVLRASGHNIFATPRGYLLPVSYTHLNKVAVSEGAAGSPPF